MLTPSTHEREQAIYDTLDTAHNLGPHPALDNDPASNLIILTSDTSDLCWSIRALKVAAENKQVAVLSRKDITIKANHILRLCLPELDDMHKGVNRAGITITSACAEFNLRGGYPLDRLDLNIDTDERIKRLIEAVGEAAPYWLHTDDATPTEIEYREETIAMVAYQAACAIVANDRGLIAA